VQVEVLTARRQGGSHSVAFATDKHALSLGGNCSVLLTGMPSVSR